MILFRLPLIVGPLPSTLVNGTTADATQVIADLNWIINQVNANAAPLATTALTNANNNFTTVQSGQAATQPANFPIASQIQNNALQTLSSVLGTNTITGRISAVPLGAYASGQVFTFFPSNANTGAATVNIDGVGARSLLNFGSNLSGAELQSYRPSVIAFDASVNAFELVNGTPYVQGPNIPSAATLNLDGTFGDYNQVDGTTPITALTLSRGRQKLLEFTSSPLISNSASLIMGSNYTPNPGDTAIFRGEGGGVARMVAFKRAAQSRFPKRTVLITASGTYTPDPGATYIDVQLVGGGGGAGGATANVGTAGNNTTFGPLTGAGGGAGGTTGGVGGGGGASTGGDINIRGASGSDGATVAGGTSGAGGNSFFSGAGRSVRTASDGEDAAANSGSGGSGGGSAGSFGCGGAAGGYVRKLFTAPLTSYAYTVGASAAGGAAGTQKGGAGAAGIIVVDEYYT